MTKNIFVVGADDFNCKQLKWSRNAGNSDFHTLLAFDDLKANGKYPLFDDLIKKAEEQLDQFECSIDGIIGH